MIFARTIVEQRIVPCNVLQLSYKHYRTFLEQFQSNSSTFLEKFQTISQRNWGCVLGHNMCLYGALCSFPFNLICNMTAIREKKVLTFWPVNPSGCWGVCKGRICASMVLCVPFPLIWYATWLFLVKTCFDLLTLPQGLGLCVRTEYVLARCSMFNSHQRPEGNIFKICFCFCANPRTLVAVFLTDQFSFNYFC